MLEWYGIPNGKKYEDIYGFSLDEVNERLTDFFVNNNI